MKYSIYQSDIRKYLNICNVSLWVSGKFWFKYIIKCRIKRNYIRNRIFKGALSLFFYLVSFIAEFPKSSANFYNWKWITQRPQYVYHPWYYKINTTVTYLGLINEPIWIKLGICLEYKQDLIL